VSGPSIESLTASAYKIPTEQPEADGTFAWSSTTMIVVEASAGGRTGLGLSYTAAAALNVVDELLGPVVRGRDAMDVPGANEAMTRAVRNVGRPGLVGMAISAVDIALWDLKSRLLDAAMPSVIGQVHPSVPVYGSGGFTTYDDGTLTDQLSGWVHGQGVPRVKIKIGESWGSREERDLARIALARSVIGEPAELYVDANGGYSVGQAVRVAHRMAEHRVSWFEEPVSSDHTEGLAVVRGQVEPDVAAGEYAWDLFGARRLCAAGSVDCLQLDVTRVGGVTEVLRSAAMAASYGLQVSGHCAPAVTGPVLACVPNLRHLEWFADHVRIERMLFDGTLDPAGGSVTPDLSRPGHGLELKGADAERWRVA
jgi:L-alanine-DL-glutamate epimerase-like enolase superfamily enzyme